MVEREQRQEGLGVDPEANPNEVFVAPEDASSIEESPGEVDFGIDTAVSVPGVAAVLRRLRPADHGTVAELQEAVAQAGAKLEPLTDTVSPLQAIRLGVLDRLAVLMFESQLSYDDVTEALGCANADPESWHENKTEALMFSSDALHIITDLVVAQDGDATDGMTLARHALVKLRGSAGIAARILDEADAAKLLGESYAAAEAAVNARIDIEHERQERIAQVGRGTVGITVLDADDVVSSHDEATRILATHLTA